MKQILLLIAFSLFFTSCKKKYQCTIATVAYPEGIGYWSMSFKSLKEKDNWIKENSNNGKVAMCK
jgi:hypothetical protein